jgi:hypothetical protein
LAKKTTARSTRPARPKPPRPAAKAPAKPATRRADLGQPGSVAIERMPEPFLSIARAADATIRKAVPGVQSIVKWGNACYYADGRAFASIYHTRSGVNIALPGTKLDDPEGLLEGTGKTMRHVKLMDEADAKRPALAKLVKQAVKFGIERM